MANNKSKESIDFKNKLNRDTREKTDTTSEKTDNTKKTNSKKKVGRPKVKTEECKTINVAIPVSVLEEMNIAKACYKDNLTLYVNTIIKKDLEANGDKYKQFQELQKSMDI